ncbi:HugZ family protein [Aestuariivita boseongensis]|uniref:HugZ family pyridoxamine 5'-phosphate oxidase n=1 Tax=Aestuariivita boseongensis TaxID=1470562 RepID=UPI00067FF138|nr:pyridoxamine 5'-phosphate oxidase family protein [Aestuariivita boseongensis]
MTNPIRPTDDAARDMARGLMAQARFCVIATLDDTGAPMTARIALGLAPDGGPVSLISQLSQHTQALAKDPRCSLLLGEPGPKGDPLTHPRLTLQARAQMVPRNAPEFDAMQNGWLESHPKSRLYIGFADFLFARFQISTGFLNGGFGKAFTLTAADLGL